MSSSCPGLWTGPEPLRTEYVAIKRNWRRFFILNLTNLWKFITLRAKTNLMEFLRFWYSKEKRFFLLTLTCVNKSDQIIFEKKTNLIWNFLENAFYGVVRIYLCEFHWKLMIFFFSYDIYTSEKLEPLLKLFEGERSKIM